MSVGIGLATGSIGSGSAVAIVTGLMTDLIEYWPLADLVGANAGRVLTNNGGVTFTTGHIDQCASFDGATQYLDIAAPVSLQVDNQDFTVSCWMKINSSGIGSDCIGVAQGNQGWHISWRGSWDTWSFKVWKTDGTTSIAIGEGSLSLEPATSDTWYYVVGWYTASDKKVHLRVNAGTEHVSDAAAFTPSADGSNFTIGRRPDSAYPMDGYISDVAFWKRALTSDEIVALYAAGAGLAYPFA